MQHRSIAVVVQGKYSYGLKDRQDEQLEERSSKVTKQTKKKILLTQSNLDMSEDLKREVSYILVLSLFIPSHPFMDSIGEGKPRKRDICSQLVQTFLWPLLHLMLIK